MFLTAVEFFPTSTLGAEYIIKVWQGENAGILMTEQLVENYTPNQWNTVMLENPVEIDSIQELWIGYHIEEFEVGDFPAGTDSGPGLAYYGDMIYFTGVWESMSDYALDYNWNIAGILSYSTGGNPLAAPIYPNYQQQRNSGTFEILESGHRAHQCNNLKITRAELLGYNIYRDSEQINASIVPDTFFIEQLPPPGTYEYFVTAVYEECESEPSNTVSIVAPPPAPEILVFPLEFVFELEAGVIIDDVMNIVNIGYDTLEYSISIAYETGTTKDDWISIDPLTGSLPEGQNQPQSVRINTNELVPGGYYATINISSNDPNNPTIEIPVTLDVITSIGEFENAGIEIFPNPAKDEVFIHSKHVIQNVRLLSLLGEVLITKEILENEVRIDVSKLTTGIYIVEVETGEFMFARKLVVE
jgi:hypothetical protein